MWSKKALLSWAAILSTLPISAMADTSHDLNYAQAKQDILSFQVGPKPGVPGAYGVFGVLPTACSNGIKIALVNPSQGLSASQVGVTITVPAGFDDCLKTNVPNTVCADSSKCTKLSTLPGSTLSIADAPASGELVLVHNDPLRDNSALVAESFDPPVQFAKSAQQVAEETAKRKKIADEISATNQLKLRQELEKQAKDLVAHCRHDDSEIVLDERLVNDMRDVLGFGTDEQRDRDIASLERARFALLMKRVGDSDGSDADSIAAELKGWLNESNHSKDGDKVAQAMLDLSKKVSERTGDGENDSETGDDIKSRYESANSMIADAKSLPGVSAKMKQKLKTQAAVYKVEAASDLFSQHLTDNGGQMSQGMLNDYRALLAGKSGRGGLYGDMVKACSGKNAGTQSCSDATAIYSAALKIPSTAQSDYSRMMQQQSIGFGAQNGSGQLAQSGQQQMPPGFAQPGVTQPGANGQVGQPQQGAPVLQQMPSYLPAGFGQVYSTGQRNTGSPNGATMPPIQTVPGMGYQSGPWTSNSPMQPSFGPGPYGPSGYSGTPGFAGSFVRN